MSEHSNETEEMYLEPVIEVDQEIIDPLALANTLPKPNSDMNICKQHC
jgi:hypothetical protein